MDRNLSDTRKRSDATGGRHKRWLSGIALLVVAGLTFVPVLLAVHDTGHFELEGNVLVNLASPPSHDWEQVYNDVLNNTNTSSATAKSFTTDGSGSASIFTGGGSKDPQDINNWLWKDSGGLPDKDNLVNSFAA